MSSSTLVRELIWRISQQLQDVTPQFMAWPESEIVMAIDDAQMAIAKYLPASSSRLDTIKLRPGSLQTLESILAANCKPGDGSTPSGPIYGKQFMRADVNMGADGQTVGRAIRIQNRKDLDTNAPNWQTVAAANGVVESIVHDPLTPKYFNVVPAVRASGGDVWLRVAYMAQPVKIPNTGAPGAELYKFEGANNTVLSVDDEYVDDIMNYVLARMNMKEHALAKPNLIQVYAAAFTGSINSKAQALTGNNPNLKRLPMVPEPLAAAS